MSRARFSKLIQDHVVKTLNTAVANEESARYTVEKDILRDSLFKEESHTAIQTKVGWETFIKQLSDPNTQFKSIGPNTSGFSTVDKNNKAHIAAATGIEILESINFDDLADYIAAEYNLKTNKYDTSGSFNQILSSSKETLAIRGINEIQDTGNKLIVLSNVDQNTLRDLILDYAAKMQPAKFRINGVKKFLHSNIQAGHSSGVIALRLRNTLGVIYDPTTKTYRLNNFVPSSSVTEKEVALVGNTINHVFKLISTLDDITGNMGDTALSAFAEKLLFGKTDPHAITEAQLAGINELAGRDFIGVGGAITNLLDHLTKKTDNESWKQGETTKILSSLFKSLHKATKSFKAKYDEVTSKDKKLVEALKGALATNTFIEEFINTESSPIFIRAIEQNLVNWLVKGAPLPQKKYRTSSTKVNIKRKEVSILKTDVHNVKEAIGRIKNRLDSIKKPKNTSSSSSYSKKEKLRNLRGQFTSLASLQVLLDANLTEQIKQNMKKPALQNRTGRFAESVKVEKLSESRAGMITAFYRYMRSPYQTFELGFRQGSNARNPKTLIAKSIRDVASQLVGNRLRSVSI